jgi:hypothetical protein
VIDCTHVPSSVVYGLADLFSSVYYLARPSDLTVIFKRTTPVRWGKLHLRRIQYRMVRSRWISWW